MPEIKQNTVFETKNSLRRKTKYKTGAGRLSWGEGVFSPPMSNKETKHKKSFRVNDKKEKD